MLTLLSMSVLTVIMLVTIVTTVADMDTQLPGSYVSVDPWAAASLGSVGMMPQDQETYADLVPAMERTEDSEPWPGPQGSDPF